MRPNNPRDKARELQNRLWVSAKRNGTRRIHALYDRIHRDDVLWVAWMRVRDGPALAECDRVLSVASDTEKTIGKPCAGKLHARFERGS